MSSRPRLLVTSSTFPLEPDDGIPRFVYDLASYLSRHMEVSAVVPDAPTAARRESLGRVEVRRFPYFWPRSQQRLAYGGGMPDNLKSSMLARLQVPFFLASSVRAIKRAVRDTGAQVVNAHWLVPQGLTAALACGRDPRVKLAVHAHSSDVHLLRRLPGGSAIARYVVGRSDLVFASSDFVRSKLDEILGFPSRAVIQPMGVDRSLFTGAPGSQPPQNHRLVELLDRFPDGFLLSVGRLVPVKGIPHLLYAMTTLRETRPGLGLVVVGDGPELGDLERQTGELGLEESVTFEGALAHREISDFLRQARVFVSDVGGVPDLVRDGQTGWLCEPADSNGLAEAIARALADSDPSTVLSAAMRETTRFEWATGGDSAARRLKSGPEDKHSPGIAFHAVVD